MKQPILSISLVKKNGQKEILTFYQFLGVKESATQDEIKSAYRKKAFQYHPDRNKGNKIKEEFFKALTLVFDTLGNPEKRKQYDHNLAVARGHIIRQPEMKFTVFWSGGGYWHSTDSTTSASGY